MIRIGIIFILLLNFQSLYCQKHDAFWIVGYSGWGNYTPAPVLNFYTGTLDTGAIYTNMQFVRTNNTICDSTGNLKFYTNGAHVYGANNQPLANSNSFNHAGGALTVYNQNYVFYFQGAVSLPYPDNPGKFITIHLEGELVNGTYVGPINLYYSLIDGDLNGGLGQMTLLNQLIFTDSLCFGSLAAVKHANGRDWWITIHQRNTNIKFSILLTPYGISPNIVQSNSGPPIPSTFFGQSVFSPNGELYSYLFGDSSKIFLFDFDRCTGLFNYNDQLTVTSSFTTNLLSQGVAFSPSSKILYVGNSFELTQFQLDSINIQSTSNVVAVYDGYSNNGSALFNQMMLMPDQRILIGTENSSLFSIIENPDSIGLSCNVNQHCLQIQGHQKYLPTNPNYMLGPIQGSMCDSLTVLPQISYELNKPKLFSSFDAITNNISFHCRNLEQGNYTFNIYDSRSQLVFSSNFVVNDKDFLFPFDSNILSPGLYIANLFSSKKMYTLKFSNSIN